MEGVRTPLGTFLNFIRMRVSVFLHVPTVSFPGMAPKSLRDAFTRNLFRYTGGVGYSLLSHYFWYGVAGMELQGYPRIMNHASVSVIKKSKRNSRCAPVESKWATQTWMLVAMMEFWWHKPLEQGLRVRSGRLMIILWSFWSAMTLARFSDAKRFFWEAVWVLPEDRGILVTVDKRKNRQDHSGSQLMMAFSSTKWSMAPVFKEYLKRSGGTVDSKGFVQGATGPIFLELHRVVTKKVKGVTKRANYTHLTKIQYNIDFNRPEGVNYDCLLNWFRTALVQTCGLTKTEVMGMGTHSIRRLGNNRAQDVGIAGNVQLEFGEWASLKSQRTYNESTLSQQMLARGKMAF